MTDEIPHVRKNVPIPDPTELTTLQLHRELQALRELVETRLDGMDKANNLLNQSMNKVPSDTDKQVSQLRELHSEKFFSIQKQFDERDIRARASEVAAQTAVNAALQAQKEAAGAQNDSNAAAILKSESSTVKQIDGITALLASNTKAIDEKIASINGRLDRGEGSGSGKASSQATMIALAAVAGSIIFGGLNYMNKPAAPSAPSIVYSQQPTPPPPR